MRFNFSTSSCGAPNNYHSFKVFGSPKNSRRTYQRRRSHSSCQNPRKRKAAEMVTPENQDVPIIPKTTPSIRASNASTHSTGGRTYKKKFAKLNVVDYAPKVVANRILSCGEGEQIGHPGRTVTRKPRAIDTFPEETRFVQVAAGGVHSLVLTEEGKIYSCGVNEKGTVPVVGLEPEGTTDCFSEIKFDESLAKLGQPVQIAAGASFAAALTKKGSVIAWGNLRDTQGDVTIHQTLAAIQKSPVVIITHKSKVIVKIVAGENHLVMLSNEGDILTFGEGSMGQLGRSARTEHIRSKYMVDSSGRSLKLTVLERGRFVKFTNVFAGGHWTMGRAEDGRIFACGLNNYGQLGIPIEEEEGQKKHSEANGQADKVQMSERVGDAAAPANAEADQVGHEEAVKVAYLTEAKAFSADKDWTHISGVQHVCARNADGEVFAVGKNLDNALGLGTWTSITGAAGVSASLGTSIAWTAGTGQVFGFGYDTVGQLGLNRVEEDEKMVPVPTEITSAHLKDFKMRRPPKTNA
uniref:Regulator of chromosome condensation n=1 Tax=Ditylenchus dipsaci TaxID=166011 RepID=A0A915DV37_9BILA